MGGMGMGGYLHYTRGGWREVDRARILSTPSHRVLCCTRKGPEKRDQNIGWHFVRPAVTPKPVSVKHFHFALPLRCDRRGPLGFSALP